MKARSRELRRSRHEYLLRQIELRGSVSASVAAEELGVTAVTIRRDIAELEAAGLLDRVHGGAIAANSSRSPRPAPSNIGVVVPSSRGHFEVVVRGMEAVSQTLRTRLILAPTQYRIPVERRHVERMVEIGVDGIIIAPTLAGTTEEEMASWASQIPVPMVFIERRLTSTSLAGFDSVRTDHSSGVALALEHLVGLGHRRVGLALFHRTVTTPLIREGYARMAPQLGLEEAPSMELPSASEAESGNELDLRLNEFLDQLQDSDTQAAVVHTDSHAARLLELAIDRGLSVPKDLAILAYDDITADLALIPLSAMAAPRAELGREALQMLRTRLSEDPGSRAASRHVALLPALKIRQSCGAK